MTLRNIPIIIISALLAIAFYTLRERKFIGYIQYRKGPNKPTLMALAVPLRDANKLFLKEEKNITIINIKYHAWAPSIIIILSLLLWPLYPHSYQPLFFKFRILYFLCVTSIRIYATFMAGWRSNSKWRIFGAMRGAAQTISYEVSISLIIVCFIFPLFTINILHTRQNQYTWTIFLALPLISSWLISILAETHRSPLDFTEGESELVSGFNIEYRSSIFALIFIAEYINILFISLITIAILTINTFNWELIIKTTAISLIFIWARRALPRLRYDILINIIWKKILPITLIWLLLIMPLAVKTL